MDAQKTVSKEEGKYEEQQETVPTNKLIFFLVNLITPHLRCLESVVLGKLRD